MSSTGTITDSMEGVVLITSLSVSVCLPVWQYPSVCPYTCVSVAVDYSLVCIILSIYDFPDSSVSLCQCMYLSTMRCQISASTAARGRWSAASSPPTPRADRHGPTSSTSLRSILNTSIIDGLVALKRAISSYCRHTCQRWLPLDIVTVVQP